ncbi:hypothetical protein DXG01_009465 [Tephrocybe rancida]|nr:hypothetical protein DXG01_009465 [Tephrocybe rancida]
MLQVLRQGSFVKKMHDLQWTQPGFFDLKNDEVGLEHSIARYHADDKVEEQTLVTAFDVTCRAWKVPLAVP